MRKKFPEIEEIEYEEIYGLKRAESKSNELKTAYNLRKKQNQSQNKPPDIEINQIITNREKIAGLENINNYLEKRNEILQIQKEKGSVKYSDCKNMSLQEFSKIKNFLESNKQINHLLELSENKENLTKMIQNHEQRSLKDLMDVFDKTFTHQDIDYEVFEYSKCEKCASNKNLQFNLKNKTVICLSCLRKGEFSDDVSFSDFLPIEKIQKKLEITDEKVLSAVYRHGDDWLAIGEELDLTREECVIRFLKINLSQKYDVNYPVFNQSKNRTLSIVSFLCSCLDPKVAATFALDIVKNLENGVAEDQFIECAMEAARLRAGEISKFEEQKFERITEVILQAQTRKLELKEVALKEMNNSFSTERADLSRFRDLYKAELDEMRREKN